MTDRQNGSTSLTIFMYISVKIIQVRFTGKNRQILTASASDATTVEPQSYEPQSYKLFSYLNPNYFSKYHYKHARNDIKRLPPQFNLLTQLKHILCLHVCMTIL